MASTTKTSKPKAKAKAVDPEVPVVGPFIGDRPTHGDPTETASSGARRTPIEKGNQEGAIGIVDRELTELGEQVGIPHGVVSHELNDQGIKPTGLPYMRCPVCGNVNIALHTLDRTEAMCPACGWDTHNDFVGNPVGKVPGLHEVDGGLAAAGEIPKGKLEGALGMDPVEAKEGVFVKDMDRPVTVTHVGDDGKAIGQTNLSLPPVTGEAPKGGDITSTKNRRG